MDQLDHVTVLIECHGGDTTFRRDSHLHVHPLMKGNDNGLLRADFKVVLHGIHVDLQRGWRVEPNGKGVNNFKDMVVCSSFLRVLTEVLSA